ncbi:MAG: cation diffusion facilitator family transporter [Pararhizobium sp.]
MREPADDRTHAHHDHHGHGHSHAPASYGRAFAIGIALNVGFVVLEAIFGFLVNSMALLADAGHNLSDVLGLVIAWVAAVLARTPPTRHFTYGLRKSSILAALFNALILLVAVGGIAVEAIRRFIEPEPTAGATVMIVAGVGIIVNGVTTWLFASGRKDDLNIRGAYMHMLADTAVSAGVVAAGLVILTTGWHWLDPTVSLLIAVVIFWGTWGLLRDSVSMSLAGVPPAVDMTAAEGYLKSLAGVTDVRDLHVWPLSTTETALTCHLVMPGGYPGDAFFAAVRHELDHRFDIDHATIQFEMEGRSSCALVADHGH